MIECKNCGYAIESRLDGEGEYWQHIGTRLMVCELDNPRSTFAEPK